MLVLWLLAYLFAFSNNFSSTVMVMLFFISNLIYCCFYFLYLLLTNTKSLNLNVDGKNIVPEVRFPNRVSLLM